MTHLTVIVIFYDSRYKSWYCYWVSTIQYNRDCCIGQKIQVSTWGPDREMGITCTFLVFINVGKSEQCLYILERRRPITHLYSPIQSGMYILDALHSSQSKRTEIKFVKRLKLLSFNIYVIFENLQCQWLGQNNSKWKIIHLNLMQVPISKETQ
jgi:hypothetical protein